MARARQLTRVPLSRRAFLQGAGALPALLLARRTGADATHRIGLVLPDDAAGEAGGAMASGAELGLDEANALAAHFGRRLELAREVAEEPAAVRAAGRRMVRGEQALALIGGADEASADALRDAAREGGALFFNVGSPADRLRGERCHRHTFHIGASLAMYVGAVGHWLEQRRLSGWALLTTDSAFGRAVEQAALALLAGRGRAAAARERVAPGGADWTAALQRVGGAAADVLFVGLETGDLLAFLRQYRAAGVVTPLAGVAPEAAALLGADPAHVAGTWPVTWHHELDRFSARELNARYRRRFGRPFDARGWAAWAAVKLLGEAVVRAGSAEPSALLRFLEGAPPFDGHKGRALTFREWDHQLRQPLYLIAPRTREPGRGRWGAFEVVAEVPSGADLDVIGERRPESRCRFEG